jgi:hypothetical protein
VARDGKFCSGRLGPGDYRLYYTEGPWFGPWTSALYYPGVSEPAQATTFKVEAGQVRSSVVFRPPEQQTYAVRGFISVDDKTQIGEDGVAVILVSPDGRLRYKESVDFRTALPLPKVKYFSFGDVVPGQYRAYAAGSGDGGERDLARETDLP